MKMRRLGPRPYKCVRRACHSHRHQPIKGLISRQMFRLVHENHYPATKKNKEWQEKLPFVVFKAKEIMYSKANSKNYTGMVHSKTTLIALPRIYMKYKDKLQHTTFQQSR